MNANLAQIVFGKQSEISKHFRTQNYENMKIQQNKSRHNYITSFSKHIGRSPKIRAVFNFEEVTSRKL